MTWVLYVFVIYPTNHLISEFSISGYDTERHCNDGAARFSSANPNTAVLYCVRIK